MEEERDYFLKVLNSLKTEKEKLENMMPEREVTLKVLIRSLADLESTVIRLETERHLLLKNNEEVIL